MCLGSTSVAVVKPIAVLAAPSGIGISPYRDGLPRRLDLAPQALRDHGLIERLGAVDRGDVRPPSRYVDLVRPAGRCRNEADVASYSRDLAAAIGELVPRAFVILLGGDCSIMLGALAGSRQARGAPVGVVYIDAHADFATLAESPSGSACSMNLALAVGRVDSTLARLAGDQPLVRGDQAVHVGRRDDAQPEYGHAALAQHDVLDLSHDVVDREGIDAVARRALERVARVDGGFWVHFDADALDPRLMPAVDSPLAGGLDVAAAVVLLSALISHPQALGLQVTIYDPTMDPDGTAAEHLVEVLQRSVASAT